jgi:hypothetical protein
MLAFENYLSLVSQMYFKSSMVLNDFMNEQEQNKEVHREVNNKKEVGRPGRKSKKGNPVTIPNGPEEETEEPIPEENNQCIEDSLVVPAYDLVE